MAFFFGVPWLSAHVGGYSAVHDRFYPAEVPNTALLGSMFSNLMLVVGIAGLLSALIWSHAASWGAGEVCVGGALLCWLVGVCCFAAHGDERPDEDGLCA